MTKLNAVSFSPPQSEILAQYSYLVKYKATFVIKHLLCENTKYNAYDEEGTKKTVDHTYHFQRRRSVTTNTKR